MRGGEQAVGEPERAIVRSPRARLPAGPAR